MGLLDAWRKKEQVEKRIEIHPKAPEIASAWAQSQWATQSLAPGVARSLADLGKSEGSADAMSAGAAKRWMARAYGAGHAAGPGTTCWVFGFGAQTILALADSRGMGWQLGLGPADEHGGGRSYGRSMLLSCDKEAVDFWPSFCEAMRDQMRMDPLEVKAQREARELGGQAGPGAAAPKARI